MDKMALDKTTVERLRRIDRNHANHLNMACGCKPGEICPLCVDLMCGDMAYVLSLIDREYNFSGTQDPTTVVALDGKPPTPASAVKAPQKMAELEENDFDDLMEFLAWVKKHGNTDTYHKGQLSVADWVSRWLYRFLTALKGRLNDRT